MNKMEEEMAAIWNAAGIPDKPEERSVWTRLEDCVQFSEDEGQLTPDKYRELMTFLKIRKYNQRR